MHNEYKIEMKLQEELKPLEEICKKLVEATKHELDGGIEKVNTEEFSSVIDDIKDMCEAKEKVVKACYLKEILKHMEKEEDEKEQEEKDMLRMLKEEYGMEEEDAKRFYRGQPRSRTSGRFMSRGDGRRSNGGRRGYEEMMPMDYQMDIEDYKTHPAEYMRDLDRMVGRMYYSGGGSSGGSGGLSGGSGGSSGQSGSSGGSGGSSDGSSGGSSGGSSRGYSEGYSDGQSRGYEEGNRRGYSEGYEQGSRDGESRGRSQGGNSRYDRARRGYEEKKEMNKGNSPQENSENMKGLEELLNVVGGDVKELTPKMSPSEKAMTAQKFDTWSKMLKQ